MKKITLILLLIFLGIPITLTILFSFFAFYKYPQLLPSKFTLDYWYNFFFKNQLMIKSVITSLSVGLLSACLSTIVGFMTARGLVHNKKSKLTKVITLYSMPLFLPITALFIGVHLVMIKLSLANTLLGVIIAHMILSIPYSTNIAISFFQGIPKNMEQLARTLGCSEIVLFKKVLLPMITPGLLFSTAVCFLLSFSDYFAALLIGGGKVITLSTLLYPYISNADYGNSATLGIVFVSINIVVFFIAEYITRKLTKINTYLFE